MKLENVALLYKDQEGSGARIGDVQEKLALPGARQCCVKLGVAARMEVGSLNVLAESVEAHKC